MQLAEIGNPTYIVLETFRKSGEGVKTPVWVAAENGRLYVWTVDNSGKVKRIRNNGRVRLAVSDSRGNALTGDFFKGTTIAGNYFLNGHNVKILDRIGNESYFSI